MVANNDLPSPTGISPLPYLIVFAILVIILIIVITMALHYWSKSHLCGTQAHIWCSDAYTCNTPCPAGSTGHSPCFNADVLGPTGLASCLYGPDTTTAKLCFTPPTTGTNELACECVPDMANQTNNCFSQCAGSIAAINTNAICCCKPGSPGCPFTQETLPEACQQTNTG